MNAKLLIRELWNVKVDWDESIPLELHTRWQNFIRQMPLLNDLEFDRKIICGNPNKMETHGFCDASKEAYRTCIYIRSADKEGRSYSRLWNMQWAICNTHMYQYVLLHIRCSWL